MTYSADSLILSTGTVSAAAIDAFMASRGQAMAPSYATDGKYVAPPAGLGAAIISACKQWAPSVVNHDVVTAQCALESAGWQSYWARSHNNPAGIGVDGTPGKGEHFDTFVDGFVAHVAHLLDYAVGRGAWTASDRRASSMPAASFGIAPTLRGLGGLWAVPGTTYGQQIASVANNLLLLAATLPQPQPGGTMVPAPPYTTDLLPAGGNYDGYAHPRTVRAFVWHIAESAGGGYQSVRSWFRNPQSSASSNWVIDTDGTIYLLVDPDHSAWTNGVDFSKGVAAYKPDLSNPIIADWYARQINPNTETESCELIGNSQAEGHPDITDAQKNSLVRLTAWRLSVRGLPADRTHIIGHFQIDSVNRPNCPGFPPAEWDALVARVAALMGGSQPAPTPQPADPTNPWFLHLGDGKYAQFAYRSGFRGFVEGLAQSRYPSDPNSAALALFGEPLADEYVADDGNTYQPCKRAVLQFIPGNGQPWDIVLAPRDTPLPARKAS